jgi:hypothetical protein
VEVRKQYQIDITNRFAALENLSDGENIEYVGFGSTLKRTSKPQLMRVYIRIAMVTGLE